jgi:hypothetical protein
MKNESNTVSAARYLKRPDDLSNLPVLTDVIVASADAQGRTLWLAWDDKRVPVLTEAVAPVEEPALPRWARKRI